MSGPFRSASVQDHGMEWMGTKYRAITHSIASCEVSSISPFNDAILNIIDTSTAYLPSWRLGSAYKSLVPTHHLTKRRRAISELNVGKQCASRSFANRFSQMKFLARTFLKAKLAAIRCSCQFLM